MYWIYTIAWAFALFESLLGTAKAFLSAFVKGPISFFGIGPELKNLQYKIFSFNLSRLRALADTDGYHQSTLYLFHLKQS